MEEMECLTLLPCWSVGEGDGDVEAEQHLITWVMGLLINALVTQTVKNKPAMVRQGSTLGSGRSPGEDSSTPIHYFCLENSLNRGAW